MGLTLQEIADKMDVTHQNIISLEKEDTILH